MFKYMYEGARTISLLPSVRQIQGGNRNSEDEDVVKQGRFSEDAQITVQQIYNNMADNVSVSEIYAVLNGLDYKKGQVPFFMYDSLILQNNSDSSSDEKPQTADTPEETEQFEYEYYPKQIEALKNSYPSFSYNSLDDIPAVISPVLRTCDNSQYTSISKGNVHDADGILYSIPFYGIDNKIKGIISVIFRTNALEAKLLNVPFLIITDDDKKEAEKLNFTMPKEKSNFLLYNEKYNIYIYDRRNIGLSDKILKGLKNNDENIIFDTLKVKSDGEWKLAYLIEDNVYASALLSENKLYNIKVTMILLITLAAIAMTIFIILKQDEKQRLREENEQEKKAVISSFSEAIQEVSHGNLNVKIQADSKGEIGVLAHYFDKLTENLGSIIADVKTNSNILTDQSQQLDFSINDISSKSEELTNNAYTISSEVGKLSETVSQIYDNSRNAAAEAGITKSYATEGSKSINNTIQSMRNIKSIIENSVESVRELDEKSKAIGSIITVINTIAKQTNLLALNAAIEASRAGEEGKGFEVVASEIRRLAQMTAEATANIESLINDAQKKSNFTLKQMEKTNHEVEQGVKLADEAELKLAQIIVKIEELVDKIDIIKDFTKKQTGVAVEIAHHEEQIATITAETSKNIESCVEAIGELSAMAKKLKKITSIFN
ncbi:methyl-accepting chemotaxis protein [Clostridium sp. DJ247]|nr:methyl-accepting chemotaxis protein [Clostridium sp. DJ247]